MVSTAQITSMVVFILIGATVFSLIFQGMDGGHWIEHLGETLPAFAGAVVPMLLEALVGIVAGALIVAAVELGRRTFGRRAAA